MLLLCLLLCECLERCLLLSSRYRLLLCKLLLLVLLDDELLLVLHSLLLSQLLLLGVLLLYRLLLKIHGELLLVLLLLLLLRSHRGLLLRRCHLLGSQHSLLLLCPTLLLLLLLLRLLLLVCCGHAVLHRLTLWHEDRLVSDPPVRLLNCNICLNIAWRNALLNGLWLRLCLGDSGRLWLEGRLEGSLRGCSWSGSLLHHDKSALLRGGARCSRCLLRHNDTTSSCNCHRCSPMLNERLRLLERGLWLWLLSGSGNRHLHTVARWNHERLLGNGRRLTRWSR